MKVNVAIGNCEPFILDFSFRITASPTFHTSRHRLHRQTVQRYRRDVSEQFLHCQYAIHPWRADSP